jgi:hypothetical protein
MFWLLCDNTLDEADHVQKLRSYLFATNAEAVDL